MEDTKIKNSEPTKENIKNASAHYNPADRDFQRTEEDIDDVSKSEKDALQEKHLEEQKQRLEKGSTTPNKNMIG